MEARLYDEDVFLVNPRYESFGNAARDPFYRESPMLEEKGSVSTRPSQAAVPVGMKILLVLMAVGICAFSCFVISRYLQISKTTAELQSLQEQIDFQHKLTEDLNLELARATDINQMMQVAEEELGMGYPTEEQFRSFSLRDSTVYVQIPPDSETPEVSRTFSGWITALIELLQ